MTDPNTITESGVYRLCGDRSTGLVIQADNVTLDLNGYSITSTTASTSCALLIDNCNNVIVKNGTIGPVLNPNTSMKPAWNNRGIVICAQSSLITLENLCMYECANNGIDISQSSNITIKNCFLNERQVIH